MRTRNADTPKSAAGKKTPPVKKEATAENTPRSAGRGGKGKQVAARASPLPAATQEPTPKPTPEPGVEEIQAPLAPEKKVPSIVKKPAGKVKSPVTGKATAMAPTVEELPQETPALVVEVEEIPEEQNPKVDALLGEKDEPEKSDVNSEEDEARGNEQVEEDGEQEVFEEPMEDEELVEEEEEDGGEGEGQEVAGGGEHEGEEVGGGGGGEVVLGGGGEEAGGDEEEGMHMDEQMQISDMAIARKIKKEQEIFVGGLDRDAVEEDLRKVFEKVGEVVEVRLHKDFHSNKNKGFAFVKFASKEQAQQAISELKTPVIRGKRCGIAPSEDNDTLFLGNICNTWTKEAIKRKLKDYGIEGVETITLVSDTQSEGLSRGFAFLEFSCHADAMLAYKRLQKPDVIFGRPDRTAKVAFAEPLREPDPEIMSQVKSVFIDGLPPYWDEDHVKDQFKGYGEIERVVLARNMSTAKRNDFGFVNFTTHEAAVACAEGVNNTELGDGKLKMKARARLANPLPKTQAVKGGMSGGFRIGHTGLGVQSRFVGRGFGRGRFFSPRAGFQGGRGFSPRAGFQGGRGFSPRAGFQGGRGFYPRGRGRGGRFPFQPDNSLETFDFRGRRPFDFRGGRRGSSSTGHAGFNRGRGRAFLPRRPPLAPGEFERPFDARHFGEDPYFYGDHGHGMKRPFSMMEHDHSYLEPGSRLRPRYDHLDPLSDGAHYRDSMGMAGPYSRDYYGSDYAGSTYSSFYGGEHSGGGYYY